MHIGGNIIFLPNLKRQCIQTGPRSFFNLNGKNTYCVLCYMIKNTTEIRRVLLKGFKGKVVESEDDTHGILVDIT